MKLETRNGFELYAPSNKGATEHPDKWEMAGEIRVVFCDVLRHTVRFNPKDKPSILRALNEARRWADEQICPRCGGKKKVAVKYNGHGVPRMGKCPICFGGKVSALDEHQLANLRAGNGRLFGY